MTIFLAAIMGNLLAWIVHSLTWWLRRRAFTTMGVIGFIGWPLGCLISWWPISIVPAAYYFNLEPLRLLSFVLLWCAIFFIGILHSHWMGQIQRAYLSFCALILELVFAAYVSGLVSRLVVLHSKTLSVVGSFSNVSYHVTFWLTLISLAIFRPLIVRYSQRFWKLIRPEKTETT